MLRQSFTDFVFVTNTDGSGNAAFLGVGIASQPQIKGEVAFPAPAQVKIQLRERET